MHRRLYPQEENTNCIWVAVEQPLIFPFAVCTGLVIHQGTYLMAQLVKHLTANAGNVGETSSIPGLGRSPGEGNSNPLHEMDMEPWTGAIDIGLQSMGSQRIGHDWVCVCVHTHAHTHNHILYHIQFNGFKVCIGCYLQNSLWNELEVQFSSVQFNRSVVTDSASPWTEACQASLCIINSWSLPKLMSIESMMPSNHFILCLPLLLLPSIFPSIQFYAFKVCIGCYLQNFLWN